MFSLLWALEGKLSLCFWHVHGFNQWKRVVIQMISNKIRHITAFHYCNQTSHQRIKEHQTHQQISIPAISLHHLFPKVFRPFILIPAKKDVFSFGAWIHIGDLAEDANAGIGTDRPHEPGPGSPGSPGSPSLSGLLTNSICCGKWCYYIYIYIKII